MDQGDPREPAAGRDGFRTLAELRPGEAGTIHALDTADPDALRKILSLGIVPGERIELIRRTPAVVFAIGASQFALDRELASRILLK